MDKVHPDIDKPTGVTHFICPESPKKDGEPSATHHLVYPHLTQHHPRCQYCGLTRSALAERNGVR